MSLDRRYQAIAELDGFNPAVSSTAKCLLNHLTRLR
ncbi:uncharacterized protein METZ01_LOCUS390681, partial [marine metagenome]